MDGNGSGRGPVVGFQCEGKRLRSIKSNFRSYEHQLVKKGAVPYSHLVSQ